eukprot:g6362.t1
MSSWEDRAALQGSLGRIFNLMSKQKKEQWTEWLRPPLEHAVAEGDHDLVLTLLKAGASCAGCKVGRSGRTLLDAAAENGNVAVVSALLEAGSLTDINAVYGSERLSPLHRAIAGGHTAAARALILAGADVSLLDSTDRSTLHYAVQGRHGVLAEDVMIAGADVNAENREGETPLHIASAAGDNHSVRAILLRGGRVSATDRKGRRPLHAAVRGGHTAVVEALLKAGADPSARYGNNLKVSPLQLACSGRDATLTRILLRHGADVKGSDGFGFTALHWAAYRGEPCVIDALIEAGADTEARSSQVWLAGHQDSHVGLTPLHIAAFFRRSSTPRMAVLIQRGADVNARDGRGQTPLHLIAAAAWRKNSVAALDFLLRWGADEKIKDAYGRTPEDLVVESASEGPAGRPQQGQSPQRHQRLLALLTNAQRDRVWRRRGMLVLCRAHSEEALRRENGGLAGKFSRQGRGVGTGASAGRGAAGDHEIGVVARVVGLEAGGLFRTIVEYL